MNRRRTFRVPSGHGRHVQLEPAPQAELVPGQDRENITLVVGDLTPREVACELLELPPLLKRFKVGRLKVRFGYGTTSQDPDFYLAREIRRARLAGFVERAIRNGDYPPAFGDLYVESIGGETSFWFCHDSEIHLQTERLGMAGHLLERWVSFGYPVRVKHRDQWVVHRPPGTRGDAVADAR